MTKETECFACGKALKPGKAKLVDTRDDQLVYVGPECYRNIKKAGEAGWQHPRDAKPGWVRFYQMREGA